MGVGHIWSCLIVCLSDAANSQPHAASAVALVPVLAAAAAAAVAVHDRICCWVCSPLLLILLQRCAGTGSSTLRNRIFVVTLAAAAVVLNK